MKQNKPMKADVELPEIEELRAGMTLLKARMEHEKILADRVLYALIAKEMVRLDELYISNAVITPLLLYPIIFALLIFSVSLPIPLVLGLAVLLYGATYWFVWRKRDGSSRDNAFGRMGQTVADVERYCQKRLKDFPIDLAKSALVIGVFLGFCYMDGRPLSAPGTIGLVVCLSVSLVSWFRLRSRYRRILRGIEAVRSELS